MRRGIFTLFLLLTVSLVSCTPIVEEGGPEFILTYAENQPEDYPTTLGAQRFAQLVEERTNGKVRIQVKYSGEYGTEEEVLKQMYFGGIDFARLSLAEISDEIPQLNVLQLPYLYEDTEHMWRILDGPIGNGFLTLFKEVNLVGLSWYDAGARCFYSNIRPIRRVKDIAGLTVRVQDSQMAMDMITLLGAKPVTFAYSDVYYAFDTNKIDVAENNWPSYQMQGHYEVARYFALDEHNRVPEVQLASGKTWDKLPKEYREVITECAQESALFQRELWEKQEQRSREDAIAAGCREIVLTEEAMQEFRSLVEPLYETYCGDYMELIASIRRG